MRSIKLPERVLTRDCGVPLNIMAESEPLTVRECIVFIFAIAALANLAILLRGVL